MDKKNQLLMSVLGVFALVIVTVGASFAFFTYSRTGTTTNSVQSGDISFTYSEVKDVTISNAFPVADSVGATDTASVYEFSVSGSASASTVALTYDVTLVSNNTKTVKANATEEELASGSYVKGYFTSDQIKVNLVKNGTEYLFGTANTGVKLSTVTGFSAGTITGSGVIANDVVLSASGKDTYQLRMWISDDVNYSNTVDGQDEQTSVGKYNGYEYSLKVKIDANAVNNYTGSAS